MRGAVATVVAIALLGVLALTASGAETKLETRAVASLAAGDVGVHARAGVRGTGEDRDGRRVEAKGLTIDNGDALARGSEADGTARAAAAARTVSVLDGRVTAYGVRRVADATTEGVTFSGRVEGLEVDGQRIGTVTDSATYELGDGRVTVNDGTTGLRVTLDDGTDIRVAVADAEVERSSAEPEATPTPTPIATPEPTATPSPDAEREKRATPRKKNLERRAAPKVAKRLTRAGYAFPIFGDATFSDDFGAARQAPIGTHQGNDVFAGFGAPVLAVTDGEIRKVGTLPISGNRLWLISESGDAFFYAHLSAFSPAAVDGRKVKAGAVLGFVGNTGDAEPTPPHVHFEVHPGGMRKDAINPFAILTAWEGRRDVPAGGWLQEYGADATDRPGALVAVRDFIAE